MNGIPKVAVDHLNWLNEVVMLKHKARRWFPDWWPRDKFNVPYYDQLHEYMLLLVSHRLDSHILNGYLLALWESDKNDFDKYLIRTGQKVTKGFFITISINHDRYSDVKVKKMISKIMDFQWIKRAKAVFEIYRKDDLRVLKHPHVHIYCETDFPKSTVLQKLFKPEYVKDLVDSSNFIQIDKLVPSQHLNYINGDKKEEKMDCVEMDIEYRDDHDIPHFWLKNWN